MDTMDGVDAKTKEPKDPIDWEPPDEWLPEEPNLTLANVELLYIDSGDPGVQRIYRALKTVDTEGVKSEKYPLGELDWKAMANNLQHPDWQVLITLYRDQRTAEAIQFNEKAKIETLRDNVKDATRVIAGRIVKMMFNNGQAIERSLVGDVKKRINTRKARTLGSLERADEETLTNHWKWLINLQNELRETKAIPLWLK